MKSSYEFDKLLFFLQKYYSYRLSRIFIYINAVESNAAEIKELYKKKKYS